MSKFRLYKNTNTKSAGYNKYYAHRKTEGLVETEDLVKRLAARYTTYAPGEVHGMVMSLTELIKELAFMGYSVKLADLGIFWVGIRSKGVVDVQNFNAQTDITSRWRCRCTGNVSGKHIGITRAGGVGITWVEDEDYQSPRNHE